MKENDGLLDPEMPTQQLRLHMGELTSNELRVARAAIAWANTRSRPVDAALKSPPECEIEETQEQKRLKWNIKVIPECLDAIERKEGRAREIAQIQFCVIHGDNIREICNAALPHCPDGFALIKLGRFKPTPFSPVTYVTKTHPDTIRVDCVGEKNSYSFALPIAAAEGK